MFQQTRSHNLCPSLIHKNDADTICGSAARTNASFRKLLLLHGRTGTDAATPVPAVRAAKPAVVPRKDHLRNVKSVQQLKLNNIELPHDDDIVQMPEVSELDAIQFDIEKLKEGIEENVAEQQQLLANIADLKSEMGKENELLVQIRAERKVKERTHLVLENPDVNYSKMVGVVANTQERIDKLKEQWDEHRVALMEQLDKARQSSTKKYVS